jgi:uncharacterized protein (DUF342 family)
MTNRTSDKTYVRMSNDEMEAYLYLAVPEDGHDYTVNELLELLWENRISYGIIDNKLEEMVKRGIHYREVLVAQGIRQIDGVEGRYFYKFDTKPSGKPAIREDGTVDYWSIFAVQTVAEGDVIAVYDPPTMGIPGKTVTGKIVEPKRGKDLLPLKGKGFKCAEDKVTYIAATDGKIEYQNGRINITNLLEIRNDLDFNNGRIDFRGDVVIHGDVEYGSYIKAGGIVTIDGNVEAITIEAKKDIILRKGLQGGGKAIIKAGGNIFAKFIEGSRVEAKGSIQADVLMNSFVSAGESILISGKKAMIIGGTVKAISRIDVPIAGNEAEIETELIVGIDDEVKERIARIKSVFKIIDTKLNEINVELSELEKKKNEGPQFARERVKERAVELLRTKIKCISDKAEFSNELAELEEKNQKAKGSCIAISKYVYPGVTVKTNSASIIMKEKQYAMEFRYEGGEVVMYNMYDSVGNQIS